MTDPISGPSFSDTDDPVRTSTSLARRSHYSHSNAENLVISSQRTPSSPAFQASISTSPIRPLPTPQYPHPTVEDEAERVSLGANSAELPSGYLLTEDFGRGLRPPSHVSHSVRNTRSMKGGRPLVGGFVKGLKKLPNAIFKFERSGERGQFVRQGAFDSQPAAGNTLPLYFSNSPSPFAAEASTFSATFPAHPLSGVILDPPHGRNPRTNTSRLEEAAPDLYPNSRAQSLGQTNIRADMKEYHPPSQRQTYVAVNPFSSSRNVSPIQHHPSSPTLPLHHTLSSPSPSPSSLKYLHAFLFIVLPQQICFTLLLSLPSVYFSRVARVFEEAELTMPEIKEMVIMTAKGNMNRWGDQQATRRGIHGANWSFASSVVSPQYEHLKAEWDHFINSLMKEWKTLNIFSVLLLSAILTTLQIGGVYGNPIIRYTALLALVCAMMSLLYGCVYIIRFNTMRKAYMAAEWAEEAQQTRPSMIWNVWILLAMPAVWLSWSIILYLFCVLYFVWQPGFSDGYEAPPELLDMSVLIPRIVVTVVFVLGVLCFARIVVTFRKYGAAMDRSWQKRVMDWVESSKTTDDGSSIVPQRESTTVGDMAFRTHRRRYPSSAHSVTELGPSHFSKSSRPYRYHSATERPQPPSVSVQSSHRHHEHRGGHMVNKPIVPLHQEETGIFPSISGKPATTSGIMQRSYSPDPIEYSYTHARRGFTSIPNTATAKPSVMTDSIRQPGITLSPYRKATSVSAFKAFRPEVPTLEDEEEYMNIDRDMGMQAGSPTEEFSSSPLGKSPPEDVPEFSRNAKTATVYHFPGQEDYPIDGPTFPLSTLPSRRPDGQSQSIVDPPRPLPGAETPEPQQQSPVLAHPAPASHYRKMTPSSFSTLARSTVQMMTAPHDRDLRRTRSEPTAC